jgi:hypothetical protein
MALYIGYFGIVLSILVLFTSLFHSVTGVDNEYEQSTSFGTVPSFDYELSK